MKYTKINLNEWSRGKLFETYIESMRVVMSLTADVNAAPLLKFTKANGLKFYPAMIWAVAKTVNARGEFKYGWNERGELIKWDFVSPSYAEFHKEDENCTKTVTEYSGDLFEFHARFLRDREKYKNSRGFVENQPPNFFDVSCLPWLRYRSFDMHVFDEGKFLAPVVTWGRYEREGERRPMPLTLNIHHAVADGFHLARLALLFYVGERGAEPLYLL